MHEGPCSACGRMEILRPALIPLFLILSEASSLPLRLSHNCSGLIQALHGRTWTPVTFDPEAPERPRAAADICASVSCGGGYRFRQNGLVLLNGSNCLSGCVYSELQVWNCSAAAGSDCSNGTDVVCGEALVNGHQAVRLAGGTGRCEGRVEMWREGQWGTVCGDGWDLIDGGVVCAQLDCGFALNVTGQGGAYGPGVGVVHLKEVRCAGGEKGLWECPSLGNANHCGHKDDAAVVCSGILNRSHQTELYTSIQTTDQVTLTRDAERPAHLTPAVWGCISLSVLLLFTFLSNVLLFLSFRRRAARPVDQRQNHQLMPEQFLGARGDATKVDLISARTTAVYNNPRSLFQRPHLNFSDDSDYEDRDLNVQSPIAMATALGRRLREDGQQVDFVRGRVESMGSTSTSSGESYENLPTYVDVSATLGENTYTPGPVHSATTHQHHSLLTNQNRVRSFQSSSTSSGECYINVAEENEQLESRPFFSQDSPGRRLREDGQQVDFVRGRVESMGSTSTSSEESYENLPTYVDVSATPGENIYTPGPVHSATTQQHQCQAGGNDHSLLTNQNRVNARSSSSSPEPYDDIEIPDEEDLGSVALRDDQECNISDSDYDDITN